MDKSPKLAASLLGALLWSTMIAATEVNHEPTFPKRIVPSNGFCSTLIPIVITGEKATAFLKEVDDLPPDVQLQSFDARAMLQPHGPDAALYIAVWAWEASFWRFAVRMTDGWLSERDVRVDLVRAAFSLHLGSERRLAVNLDHPRSIANQIHRQAMNGHYGRLSQYEWRWLGDLHIALNSRNKARVAYVQGFSAAGGAHRNAGLNICIDKPWDGDEHQKNDSDNAAPYFDLSLETDSGGLPGDVDVVDTNSNIRSSKWVKYGAKNMRFRPDLHKGRLVGLQNVRVRLVAGGTCDDYLSLNEPVPDNHQLLCHRHDPEDLIMRRLYPNVDPVPPPFRIR